ncbi:MAG: ATP-binding protein, partial [bacterium]
ITNVISAGAVAVIWSQNRGRFAGISFWLVDMILQAGGSALIVLRGLVPDFISMTLANAMIQAGALIIFIGLERFTGKRGWQIHNYVLLAAFIAVSAYYGLVQPDLRAREIALSVTSMIYTFQCCWLLLRRADPGMRRITRLTGIVFAVYAAFSLARICLHAIFPTQTSDFFKSGAVDALAITFYIVLSVCLAISLVLMVNRRLLADVKAQEEKFTTAFQSSPYAITLTRPSDGTIFEVNDGFVNLTGYRYGEVIGKTTLGLRLWVREEDRRAVTNELAQGREIHGVEYQFRKKTGEVLTGLFSASQVTINSEKCILASISDITERKRAEHQSAEWMKELQAFFSLSELTEREDITLDELHQEFTNILPKSWQYPEIACARIVIGDSEFHTENFAESPWKQSAPIKVDGLVVGRVEVGYLQEKPDEDEGPFQKEERLLLNAIAERLGHITERKGVEEQIRLHEVHLQDLLSLHRMAKTGEKEILDFTLEASLRAAQSQFTFVGLMNADETVLTIHAWSKETMEQCAITEKPIQFPLAQTSLLGESVRQRRPIIVNDYFSSDLPKRGIPSGHVPITRFLSVPVFSAGKIVAVGAVANKGTNYSDSDISAFSALLNEMWNLLEQKLKDEALRASEAKFRAMVETLPLAIHLTTGIEQITEYVNPTMVKLFGYTQEDLPTIEQWWPLAYPDETYRRQISEEWTRRVKHAIETQSPIEPMEVVVTCKDGSKKNISWGYITLGERNYSCGLDLTDRKQLEERIRQVRSDLLFAVSHDLKSPLQSLHQTQEMLNELTPGEGLARFQEYSEIWRRNLQRLERMINNLVDSQRGEEDRFPLLPAPCDPVELVRRVAEDLTGYAPSQHVAFDLKLEPVPEGSCDQEAIARVVENLLTNAVKFSPQGGQVEIRLGIEGDALLLEMEDHGVGIPAQEQAQLFQPFQRGRSAQQKKIPGTGLGLYVCRRIVEEHGGTIALISEEGKGTKVTVRLPWGVE